MKTVRTPFSSPPIEGVRTSERQRQPEDWQAAAQERAPRLLVVCRSYGVASEVWMQRQIAAFEHFSTQVLTWQLAATPLAEQAPFVHCLQTGFDDPEASPLRWARRFWTGRRGNFCATWGRERRELDALVRRLKPDVLLCHFGMTALRLLPVARALRLPLVAHFHGHDISSSLQHNRYYRWSLRRCARQFAACIIVGSHQERILRRFGVPPERIELIPCGAPTEDFQSKVSYDTEACRFVAVSRLVPWKGLQFTVRAFAEVHQKRPRTELHIVGEGPEDKALHELVHHLGLHGAVIFHGRRGTDDVRALLHRCDVFVQHSIDHESGWTEGFGVSIAEASAAGLPVIVTDSGGIPDQINDGINGLLSPQRDVRTFARLMLELARDPEKRRRLGLAGRERVQRDFDSRLLTRRLERRLLDLASLASDSTTPRARTTSPRASHL